MILCLDPGVSASNAAGLALFNPDLKALVAATVIRPDKLARDGDRLDRYYSIAEDVIRWVFDNAPRDLTHFVVEWPQAYPETRIDPNTALIPLAGLIGTLSGWLYDHEVIRVSYLPHAWKGSVKADTFLNRILDRLQPFERKVLDAVQPASLRHNAIDAAGLGLHFLGRLGRSRAVHNEVKVAG